MLTKDKANIPFYIYDSGFEEYQDGLFPAKVNVAKEKGRTVTVVVVECEKNPDLIGICFTGDPTIGNKSLASSIDNPGYIGFFYIDSCREYILSRLKKNDKELNSKINSYIDMQKAADKLLSMAYLNRLINYKQIDKLKKEIAEQEKE